MVYGRLSPEEQAGLVTPDDCIQGCPSRLQVQVRAWMDDRQRSTDVTMDSLFGEDDASEHAPPSENMADGEDEVDELNEDDAESHAAPSKTVAGTVSYSNLPYMCY